MPAFSNGLKQGLTYALGPGGTALEAELEAAVVAIPVADISLANTHILVGNAGGLAADVAVSGDIAMADTGAATVISAKLASSHLDAIKTDVGTKVLLTAAAVDRNVQISVRVTTTFADGNGTQPTLQIGQTGTVNKFADTGDFTGKAAAAACLVFAGVLSSGQQLLATQVAGTGTTETGAYTIVAQAVS